MTGLCDNGHAVHWRNTRGGRKPEQCHFNDCGAPVHMARFNGETGKYEIANSSSRPGTKLVDCALCGRKRRHPSNRSRMLEYDTLFKVYVPGKFEHKMETVPAGEVVCWYHQETGKATTPEQTIQ